MDESSVVASFCSITGASDQEARHFIEASSGDLQTAIDAYFSSQGADIPTSEPTQPLQSDSAPQSDSVPTASTSTAASGSRSKPPKQNKKFGSLRDLQQSDSAGEDSSDDKDQEYFAGGDKSGLAVQDPSNNENNPMSANEHIQRLLNTARQNRPRPPGARDEEDEEDEKPQRNNFSGTGMTLGGEGTESRAIPDPNAPPTTTTQPERPQMVERTLHLWDDGFSVDDGPLFRYDDPRNARTLEMINRGSAPLDLMNVESGQAVDVKLDQHRGEKYVRPKKKYRPFEGGGQRLGSPTPGAPSTSSTTASSSTATPSAPAGAEVKPDVDPSQPTVRLQIRLADGTRLPAQFNTSATIGDVRGFVQQAHPDSQSRAYVLATTFPTKEFTDEGAVIGEISELKRGGNLVQKWV